MQVKPDSWKKLEKAKFPRYRDLSMIYTTVTLPP